MRLRDGSGLAGACAAAALAAAARICSIGWKKP